MPYVSCVISVTYERRRTRHIHAPDQLGKAVHGALCRLVRGALRDAAGDSAGGAHRLRDRTLFVDLGGVHAAAPVATQTATAINRDSRLLGNRVSISSQR